MQVVSKCGSFSLIGQVPPGFKAGLWRLLKSVAWRSEDAPWSVGIQHVTNIPRGLTSVQIGLFDPLCPFKFDYLSGSPGFLHKTSPMWCIWSELHSCATRDRWYKRVVSTEFLCLLIISACCCSVSSQVWMCVTFHLFSLWWCGDLPASPIFHPSTMWPSVL